MLRNTTKISKYFYNYIRNNQGFLGTMSVQSLGQVADVDIDPAGVFKYILIKVYATEVDGVEPEKMIVRGYKECPFHADIYDKVTPDIQKLGLDTECVGGGRINHDPDAKNIKVYGYSQGYGKADHSLSVVVLKKTYPDYDISWTDDGY
ncbi:janus A [Carabus blaptoides fortunei]